MTDGFDLLSEDHREVERLFGEFESTGDDVIARRICTELTAHSAAEERALYPRVREALDDGQQRADQLEDEHAVIANLIARVYETPAENLRPIMGEIKTNVEHHAQEEDQELFPAMRDAGVDADAMGAEVEAAKHEALRRAS